MIDAIFNLFRTEAAELPELGGCTHLQHSLQCASLAETSGASSALVSACLLHDLGHLIPDWRPFDRPVARDEQRHADLGEAFLERWFPPGVTRPIGLHVAAKGYLCAAQEDYRDLLSEASRSSLRRGRWRVMTPQEADRFLDQPFAYDAIRLRRWDDAGKLPEGEGLDLERFRHHLERTLRQ